MLLPMPQRPAWTRVGDLAVIDHHLTTHQHEIEALRVQMRLAISCPILRIEDDEIRLTLAHSFHKSAGAGCPHPVP